MKGLTILIGLVCSSYSLAIYADDNSSTSNVYLQQYQQSLQQAQQQAYQRNQQQIQTYGAQAAPGAAATQAVPTNTKIAPPAPLPTINPTQTQPNNWLRPNPWASDVHNNPWVRPSTSPVPTNIYQENPPNDLTDTPLNSGITTSVTPPGTFNTQYNNGPVINPQQQPSPPGSTNIYLPPGANNPAVNNGYNPYQGITPKP